MKPKYVLPIELDGKPAWLVTDGDFNYDIYTGVNRATAEYMIAVEADEPPAPNVVFLDHYRRDPEDD